MKMKALIVHTFRELFAKATLYVLAGISTLVILFVLLGLSAETSGMGVTVLLFGKELGPPLPADKFGEFVLMMQAGFANALYAGLVLFGVFATAGVIPDMLEKGTVDLYLSKPISRWELLLGKYFGATAVMFTNVFYFIGALWVIIGIKLGVWNAHFILSTISLTFTFACLYSIVAFIGVLSRNTALSIIGAFLYLFVVSPLLEKRVELLFLLFKGDFSRRILDGMYYIFPQISAMQEDLVNQIAKGDINWKPFLQSFLSGTVILLGAVGILNKKDF